jgi:hypothetical protein
VGGDEWAASHVTLGGKAEGKVVLVILICVACCLVLQVYTHSTRCGTKLFVAI